MMQQLTDQEILEYKRDLLNFALEKDMPADITYSLSIWLDGAILKDYVEYSHF